jgi:hypothetical protein
MACEVGTMNINGFASHGGCNISVTLSDGSFVDSQIARGDTSPKKTSFFDSLIKKTPSSDNKKEKNSSWTNIFSKKSSSKEEEKDTPKENQKDEEMARFIEQLEMEGKTEDEIKLHLSHIHIQPATPVAPSPAPAKSKNIVSQFFSDVQQAFKEIGFSDEPYEFYDQSQEDIRGLTISISSAPFYGALPPDMDMTYEELASLEPVYVGSRCINNLPSCTHDGTPLPGDQTKCSVCLSDFVEGDTLKSLPCVHFFHKDCIDTWLMVGHTCPLCKTLIE